MDSLRRAAQHLPHVDAIGGSAAGVYVDNQVRFASLFRGVAPEVFEQRVKNMFRDLKREWNGVPFDVVNDGDVAALLGSMSLRVGTCCWVWENIVSPSLLASRLARTRAAFGCGARFITTSSPKPP